MKLKLLLTQIWNFFGANEPDINKRYSLFVSGVCALFMLTQIVFSIHNLNIENQLITIFTFLSSVFFFVSIKFWNLFFWGRNVFTVTVFISLLSFWLSTQGILGSMPLSLSPAVFFLLSFYDTNLHLRIIISTILFAGFLICIDLYCPEYILSYPSVPVQKMDVIAGMFFSIVITATSFSFLKSEYQKKERELNNRLAELKQLNEELDSFVYRVSHDLRAPIASSLGLTALMKTTEDITVLHKYTQLQEQSFQRLDNFILDVLNYSRNARLGIIYEEISIHDFLNNTLAAPNHGSLPIEIKVENEVDSAIYSDKFRLQIIFNNLIGNAIQYYDARKEVSFLKIHISQNSHHFFLKFEDNGIGIEEDLLPRIFEMFFRANTTTKGSGVGLYIVQQMTLKLGGTVTCESELGQGTTFKIKLPRMLPELISTF